MSGFVLLIPTSKISTTKVVCLWLISSSVLAADSYSFLGWTKLTGSTKADYGTSVAVSGDGSIYATGYTYGAITGQSSAGNVFF